jgi:hypothetical protein
VIGSEQKRASAIDPLPNRVGFGLGECGPRALFDCRLGIGASLVRDQQDVGRGQPRGAERLPVRRDGKAVLRHELNEGSVTARRCRVKVVMRFIEQDAPLRSSDTGRASLLGP